MLTKFKAEAKLKSKKRDLFNSYLNKTNNIDDKIALIRFKYKDDNQHIVKSIKKLIKKIKLINSFLYIYIHIMYKNTLSRIYLILFRFFYLGNIN